MFTHTHTHTHTKTVHSGDQIIYITFMLWNAMQLWRRVTQS